MALLLAVSAQAQKRWDLSLEQEVGVGVGYGPKVVATTEFVAACRLGSMFSIGPGVGFRVNVPLTTYKIQNGVPSKQYLTTLGIPLFVRLGLQGRIWYVRADAGYTLDLVGISNDKDVIVAPHLDGFFLEPHAGVFLGKHSTIGLGVQLQDATVTKMEITRQGDLLIGSSQSNKKLVPAITLRYAFRF